MNLIKTSWIAFIRPQIPVFQRAGLHKNNFMTFMFIAAGAVAGTLFSWLIHRFTGDPQQEFMGLASVWMRKAADPPFATWTILVPCGVVYGFYTYEIVLFIFAWLLKGKGSFGMQAYMQSLFYVPLSLTQQIVVVIPGIGRLLFALVAVYSLFPTTISLKAAHGYSNAQAILTWILPVLLNVIIVAAIIYFISLS